MAALNIAHEHLSQAHSADEMQRLGGPQTALDFGAVKRRISHMEAELDAVLAPQDKLL